MIAVIGTKSTNDVIKNILGFSKKNYDIEYLDYKNTNQIKVLANNEKIEGILFSGLIGLKLYDQLDDRMNVPYDMVSADINAFIMNVFEIILKHKSVNLEEMYFDYMHFMKVYTPELYNLFPKEFTESVHTFEFESLNDFRSENVYEDIKLKYNAGQIKLAVLTAAKITEELNDLGIIHFANTLVSEDVVISSYNRLIADVNHHQENMTNLCSVAIEGDDKVLKDIISNSLLDKKVTKRYKNILIFSLKSNEIVISNDLVCIKKLNPIMELPDIKIGVGTGKTEKGSVYNAVKAIKYTKTFNASKAFLLTEDRDIYGPVNDEKCLKINEYELEAHYDYARSIGVKTFNYCRILSLYEKNKLLSTEEVCSYLNIARRSGNRILTVLENEGVLELSTEVGKNKVGRPQKKYRLAK